MFTQGPVFTHREQVPAAAAMAAAIAGAGLLALTVLVQASAVSGQAGFPCDVMTTEPPVVAVFNVPTGGDCYPTRFDTQLCVADAGQRAPGGVREPCCACRMLHTWCWIL